MVMRIQKKNKLLFYLRSYSNILLPFHKNFKNQLSHLKKQLSSEELENIEVRVRYYCKTSFQSAPNCYKIADLRKPKNPKSYYFDTYEYAQNFDKNLPLNFVFGDVTHVPEFPSIVKSRPITTENENSVVLNLDKARHFVWVENDKEFQNKIPKLIGRGAIFDYQPHRIDFYKKYFNHPLCDLGQTNNHGDFGWQKPKISIADHLNYKFILSLQGNDVATNLKWIMSSNSIAVMPKPTMETWFMEGKLVGGKHYIEIKSDYSDLEEQLQFYIENPEKCLEILENAHTFCKPFFNKNAEDYCSLCVLEKYFGLG